MAIVDLLPDLFRAGKMYVEAKEVFKSNKTEEEKLRQIKKIDKHWHGSSGFPLKTYGPIKAIGVCIALVDMSKFYIELREPDEALRCLDGVSETLSNIVMTLPPTGRNVGHFNTAHTNNVWAQLYMAKAYGQKVVNGTCYFFYYSTSCCERASSFARMMAESNPSISLYQDLYDDTITFSYRLYKYLQESLMVKKSENDLLDFMCDVTSSYVRNLLSKDFEQLFVSLLEKDPGNSRIETYLNSILTF